MVTVLLFLTIFYPYIDMSYKLPSIKNKTKFTTTLDHDIKLLSIEAFNFSDLTENLKNISYKLITALKNSVSKLDFTNETILDKNFLSLYKELEKKLHKRNYIEISTIKVSVPENLNTSYITYVRTLHELHKSVYLDITDLVDEYKLILSNYVNDSEFRKSSKLDVNTEELTTKRQECEDMLNNCFIKNSPNSVTRVNLGNAIQSFSELHELTEAVIKLDKEFTDNDAKYIADQIEMIDELLGVVNDILIKGKIEKTSGVVANDIAVICYELAKLTEFFSIIRNSILEIIKTIQDTYKFLLSI